MNAFINNGIEFVLPGIFKPYLRERAVQFLEKGTIYFTNLAIFQQDENVERGDPSEGLFEKLIYLSGLFFIVIDQEPHQDIGINRLHLKLSFTRCRIARFIFSTDAAFLVDLCSLPKIS